MMTFRELTHKYIAWSEKHQAAKTTQNYKDYLNAYINHIGALADDPAETMKPLHVEDYIAAHPEWSDTYKNVTVVALNRPFNWGMDNEFINKNPIRKAKKPSAEGRKTYATEDDITAMLAHLHPTDPLRDFIICQWHMYARPQEIRHIEARHVNLAMRQITFPKKESKGKKQERCLLILKDAYPIVERLVSQSPEGKIFRNNKGDAWQNQALCARFRKLSALIKKNITPYDLRHGIVTNALERGISVHDIAAASGHANPSMIDSRYSHVHQNKGRLFGVLG